MLDINDKYTKWYLLIICIIFSNKMKIREKKVMSLDDKNKVKTYSLLNKHKLKVSNTNDNC